MRVFKGYMLLMKRNIGFILLYFSVFVGITAMIQTSMTKTTKQSFSLSSMKITVIDRDEGELAQGLSKYLGTNNQLVKVDDNRDALRDALYFRKTEFIVYVPEDFENRCLNGTEKVGITSVPGSYTESYVSYQIDTYLNQVETYEEAGYPLKEAIQKTVALQKVQPEVTVQQGSNAVMADYMYSFRYLPYLFLATLCCAIGTLLAIFRKEEVKERISCSPVSSPRRTGEMVLALSVTSVVLWMVSLVIAVLQSGGAVLSDTHIWEMLANSFLLLMSCTGIAIIAGTLVRSAAMTTNAATVISLGISFLCGVFVPLELMAPGVKKVVQVLPVYWYEVINDQLANYKVLTGHMKMVMYKGFVIQLVFALACICVAMLISKMQDEKSK